MLVEQFTPQLPVPVSLSLATGIFDSAFDGRKVPPFEATPPFVHPGDSRLADRGTGDHDHCRDREDRHHLKRFEALFVMVELAKRVGEFCEHGYFPKDHLRFGCGLRPAVEVYYGERGRCYSQHKEFAKIRLSSRRTGVSRLPYRVFPPQLTKKPR
jgi:hypothetical protein